MAFNIFIAFWSVSILFIITPGADWAYAISAGIKGKVVVPAVAGMLFGHFITILLVAAGVGLLVANNPTALMILTVAGSAYLLWMGINLLLTPPTPNKSGSVKSSVMVELGNQRRLREWIKSESFFTLFSSASSVY